MAFCHGKKAANSYEGFIAIVLILSEFLRSGLLTSREFDEIIILKMHGLQTNFWETTKRGHIIVERCFYCRIQ